MAAKSEAARAGEANADAGGHVGRTLEAAVTHPPGWHELAWDGVTLVEAVSPPAAIASAAVIKLIYAAR